MHSYSGAPPEHQPTSREKNYPLNHCLDSLSSESCCFQPVSSSLRKENLFTGTLESLQISGSSVLLYSHGPLPAPIAVILSSKASPNLNPDPFLSDAANSGLRHARSVSPLSPWLLGKVPGTSHTSSMEPSRLCPTSTGKRMASASPASDPCISAVATQPQADSFASLS